MKLPMRFRILTLIAKKDTLSDVDIFEALKSEYGTEGQYRKSEIIMHLHSLRAAGLLEDCAVSLNEKGDLQESFKLTDFGRSRLNLLPGIGEIKSV